MPDLALFILIGLGLYYTFSKVKRSEEKPKLSKHYVDPGGEIVTDEMLDNYAKILFHINSCESNKQSNEIFNWLHLFKKTYGENSYYKHLWDSYKNIMGKIYN